MDSGTFLVNLLKIDKSARDLTRNSPVYRSHFTEWRDHREVTVQVVEALSKKMANVHLASNATKGTGAVVAVIGGAVNVAGVALKLTGHNAASKLLRSGTIAQVIGSVATSLATLAEFGFTRNVENEVKTVLQRDMELMEVISQWIHRSIRLNSAVQEIFGYDIQSRLLFDVVKICYHNVRLVVSAASTIEGIIALLQKQVQHSEVSELPDKIPMIVLNIMEKICENPKLIEPLRNICVILMNDAALMDILLLGLKLNNLMQTLFNLDAISSILTTFGLPVAKYVSEVPRAACNTVGIALNVVIIIFVAKNIQKGSEYSEKLRDLSYLLKLELKELDAEYKQICN